MKFPLFVAFLSIFLFSFVPSATRAEDNPNQFLKENSNIQVLGNTETPIVSGQVTSTNSAAESKSEVKEFQDRLQDSLKGQSQEQNTELEISLDQAIEESIRKNLQVKISRDSVKIAELDSKILRGLYAPIIGSESNYRNEKTPVTNVFAGGQNGRVQTESWNWNTFLKGQLPTGGKYDLSFDNRRTRTDNQFQFQFLVPEYSSTLKLSVTQPLLKNMWIDENRRKIKIAKINKQISEDDFDLQLQEIVYKTEITYQDFVLAGKTVSINQESVDLAKEQLRRTERLGEIGEAPKIDAVSAEAEYEKRKEELAVAEEKLYRAENALKLLIADGIQSFYWQSKIKPSEKLEKKSLKMASIQSALQDALFKRPEFRKIDKQLKAKGVERRYLINQGFPQLDLVTDYSMQGVSGSPRALQSSPFGGSSTILPRFTGDYSDNLDNVFSNDFNTIQVGINLSWPIAPGSTKKILKKNDLEINQFKIQLDDLTQNVNAEIKNADNAIKTAEQRIKAAEASLNASEKQLDGEIKKFKLGLTTNFLVLTRQNELSQARLRRVSAIADYNKAVSELEKAAGIILAGRNISVE
jgi:outer membrane protein TolC